MKTRTVYYCRRCVAPFVNSRCRVCYATLDRDLEDDEAINRRAIIKLLQLHRAEFFQVLESEKQGSRTQ